jgi:hypothetical protein
MFITHDSILLARGHCTPNFLFVLAMARAKVTDNSEQGNIFLQGYA